MVKVENDEGVADPMHNLVVVLIEVVKDCSILVAVCYVLLVQENTLGVRVLSSVV